LWPCLSLLCLITAMLLQLPFPQRFSPLRELRGCDQAVLASFDIHRLV